MMIDILVGVLGLILLTLGAEFLVRGGVQIGRKFSIPPTIIGIVIIGYGTSLPELSTSVMSSLKAMPEVAVGNVLGSNIFNILFVLGLTAMITPLAVDRELLKRPLPGMVVISFLCLVFGVFGFSPFVLAVILLISFVAFTGMSLKSTSVDDPSESAPRPTSTLVTLAQIALGLIFLISGTNFFIQGAVSLSRWVGISEAVIGLSVVSVGTSLPEVVSSVVAALKGERSMVLGNIVGSNIFNLCAVLGSSLIVSQSVSLSAFKWDWIVMFLSAFICIPLFLSGRRVSRGEGALLMFGYIGYFAYLMQA